MTLVKICGIRRPEHALAAAEAGADFIGLVFAESRRRLSVEEARAIVRALGVLERRPLLVGVFANADARTVNGIAEEVGLDLVQLSGDEPWEMCRQLSRPVIKAVKVRPGASAGEMMAGFRPGAIPLLDTYSDEAAGGTGQTFDWQVAREVAARRSIILAGGLTPQNVGEAIRTVRPWAVDVSSGVETEGVKDVAKIGAFVAAAKEAG